MQLMRLVIFVCELYIPTVSVIIWQRILRLHYDKLVSTESSLVTENLERIEAKPHDGRGTLRIPGLLLTGVSVLAVTAYFSREERMCRTTRATKMTTSRATVAPKATARATVTDA